MRRRNARHARVTSWSAGLAVTAAVVTVTTAAATPPPLPPEYGSCSDTVAVAVGVTVGCRRELPGTSSPNVTHVASIDLTAGGVRPKAVLGNDVVYQTPGGAFEYANETVSSMMGRTSAVLGINGGFFDNNKGPDTQQPDESYSGQICGGFVTGGRIVKSPPSSSRLNVSLAVHADGHLSIGHVTFSGTVSTASASIALDGINALDVAAPQPSCPKALAPGPTVASGITMITPDMGDVVLEGSRHSDANSDYRIDDAVLVLAHRSPSNAPESFVVDAVSEVDLLTAIPQLAPDQVALLSSQSPELEDAAEWLLTNLPVGTEFTAGGELSDATITELLGAPAPLVIGGQPVPEDDYYAPEHGTFHAETMLGIDAAGRVLTIMVVDDYSGWSSGITVEQAQRIMIDAGVDSAVLFDGGGSSTLAATLPAHTGQSVCNSRTVLTSSNAANYPNGCANQRLVGDALVFIETSPPAPPVPNDTVPDDTAQNELAASGGTHGGSLALTLSAGTLLLVGLVMRTVTKARRRPLHGRGQR